jgi:glycosyltransferase involved in cell wall biosynthesis
VIVPFHGTAAEADAVLAQLGGLRLRDGDELIVADNTAGQVAVDRACGGPVTAFACEVEGSAYAARNEGAEHSRSPWLLFVDADCRLPEDLLDAYFARPPGPRAGAVAGQVLGAPGQPGIVPSYIRSRRHLDQEVLRGHVFRPMAVTANLLVRREAWAELGGFAEMTRSGADSEFCWRLQDAGWELEYAAEAGVLHEHRANLPALLRQTRRDGAGGRWLATRYAGYPARHGWGSFGRAALGALAWPLLGQPRRGLFKALDGVWSLAFNVGTLDDNAPARRLLPASTVVVLDEFPAAADARLSALTAEGGPVRVEARRRPTRMAWRETRGLAANIWEDEGVLTRIRSSLGLRLTGGGGAPAELAAPARRLRTMPRGGQLLAEESMLAVAEELRLLAGRPDIPVEPLGG